MKIFLGIVLCFSVLSGFVGPAEAEKKLGQEFAQRLEAANTRFVLQGLGAKSYLLIKVLVAGFYLGEGFLLSPADADVPKRIEVAYFYPVPGRKLAVETRKRIILNTSREEFRGIQDRVDQMDAYFVDLRPGDRYALTYVPGQGTQFSYNQQQVGVIPGYDFAKALFAVWIGDKPLSPQLKADLLGKRNSHKALES